MMGPAALRCEAGSCLGLPSAGARSERSATPARPLAQRGSSATQRSCCSAAVSGVEGIQTSSWYTQPVERAGAAELTSREASALEETFWHHPVMEVPATRDEAMVMMERLHQETAAQASSDGINVVAFTGGSGPALTAYLLNNLFDGSVVGCIGNVANLAATHVEHAKYVADLLGFELVEVDNQTWSKFSIPEGLATDADELCSTIGPSTCEAAGLRMFSGATADDVAPFMRRGEEMHGVVAPLAGLSRAAVNSLSQIIGLPVFQE